MSLGQLTRLLRVNAHHESAVYCKRNTVVQGVRPNGLLSRAAMKAVALDYILFGNAYVRQVPNRAGRLVRLTRHLARTMRWRLEPDRYWQVPADRSIDFAAGEIILVKLYALEPSMYGLPDCQCPASPPCLPRLGTIAIGEVRWKPVCTGFGTPFGVASG